MLRGLVRPYGTSDKIISGNPNMTYMKEVYKKHTRVTNQLVTLQFNDNFTFGQESAIELYQEGDIINDAWLVLTFPAAQTQNTVTYSMSLNYNITKYGTAVFVSGGTLGFVSVYSGGQDFSNDGKTWNNVSSTAGSWTSVTFGNGRYVAVGTDTQMYSIDGKIWSTPTSTTGSWSSITFGNGIFVAVGTDKQMFSINNGATWSTPTTTTGTWTSVTFGNGRFVTVGQGGIQMVSLDGKIWTNVINPLRGTWNSVSFGNNTFISISNEGLGMYSINGQDWTEFQTVTESWTSVTFAKNIFVFSGINTYNFLVTTITSYQSNAVCDSFGTYMLNWVQLEYGNKVIERFGEK